MDRREALKEGAIGLGLLTLLGAGIWTRHNYGVRQLKQELLAPIATVTTTQAHEELVKLSAKAGHEIRLYFHGLCLDAHAFTSEICSASFAERLGAWPTAETRRAQIVASFERHVVTPAAVLNRVDIIAAEIGDELDHNWAECCTQIARVWGAPLKATGNDFHSTAVLDAVEPLIRESIRRSMESAATATVRPTLSEMGRKIGESAVLLLPVIRSGPQVGWPLFMTVALTHFADYVLGWLFRSDANDLQGVISSRLALLGNRVAVEFERDVRRRIARLHEWQDQAIRTVAHSYAEAAVAWF